MRAFICLCILVGLSNAKPQYRDNNRNVGSSGVSAGIQQFPDSRNALITKYNYENDAFGRYSYTVTQNDGILNEQHGEIENVGTDDESSKVYGYYAYPGNNGEILYVEYVADKNGFKPAGRHLPKSAGVGEVGQLGIPSTAIASLAGGGLG